MQHLRIGSVVTVHFAPYSGQQSFFSAAVTNITDSYLETDDGPSPGKVTATPWSNILFVEVTQD